MEEFYLPNIEVLKREKILGVDTETKDPKLKEQGPGARMYAYSKNETYGKICGISIATLEDKWYLPIGHAEFDQYRNLREENVLDFMKDLADSGVATVGANYIYDLQWFKAYGIEFKGPVYDCQLAESLINENRKSFKLDDLAVEYMDMHKDETEMITRCASIGIKEKDVKASMHLIPGDWVSQYAKIDAWLALQILNKQEKILKDLELWDIFQFESRLTKMVLDMMWKGVRIDVEAGERYNQEHLIVEEQLLKDIHRIAKFDLNPWSSDDVGKALEGQGFVAGKDFPLTPKEGKPSITEGWLQSFNKDEQSESGAFVTLLKKYRKTNKIRRDFIEGTALTDEVKAYGRVHCQFHQNRKDENGTRSGRFSSSNPNLQQQPSRDKFWKPIVRGLYLPEEGYDWVRFDYSQQEFRLFGHYACERRFDGAAEVARRYKEDPTLDFHQIIADMIGIERTPAKTINFGVLYGMGAAKMSKNLGVTLDEAKELTKQYHSTVPFAKGLANEVTNYANTRGWIKTKLGRRRNFNLWEPVKSQEDWKNGTFFDGLPLEEAKEKWPNRRLQRHKTYSAVNSLIQGSAADMTKLAMLKLYEEYNVIPALQVHDELDFTDLDKEMIPTVKNILETVMELHIPIVADCEIGSNWGNLTKFTM